MMDASNDNDDSAGRTQEWEIVSLSTLSTTGSGGGAPHPNLLSNHFGSASDEVASPMLDQYLGSQIESRTGAEDQGINDAPMHELDGNLNNSNSTETPTVGMEVEEPRQAEASSDNLRGEGREDQSSCEAWWKRRAALWFVEARQVNILWSLALAAEVMGLVILSQRWQHEQDQNHHLRLQLCTKDELPSIEALTQKEMKSLANDSVQLLKILMQLYCLLFQVDVLFLKVAVEVDNAIMEPPWSTYSRLLQQRSKEADTAV